MAYPQGDTLARSVAARVVAPQATLSALAALPDEQCVDGAEALVLADGSRWRFKSGATSAADNILVAGSQSSGKWVRCTGAANLVLAIDYTKADAAVLLTVPAGCKLHVVGGFWEVTVGFTGGSSSAIGLSSSAYSTKGDLLGGASGDVAASLTAGAMKRATVGAKIASGVFLTADDTVLFDRIASAFTAGSGNAHLSVVVLAEAS